MAHLNNELKKIKKRYGEDFMKLCRSLFPTILEQEGKLYEILCSSLSTNCKTFYEDITKAKLQEEFREFIYSKFEQKDSSQTITDKTPYELLDEAGYILTECTTEEEIQSFRKYYAPNEQLCTFHGDRLDQCFVFWAVKKNVADIKREDFSDPKRDDEYGTSVMSIQFYKHGICTVSIKNRYNHSVDNPDATCKNELDRIIPGLEQSFAKLLEEREVEFSARNKEKFTLPSYTVANDGKYYKYNIERNGIYYCPYNIIIKNGQVYKLENPEQQILIDYFILDLKNKTIRLYDSKAPDSFVDDLQKLRTIEIKKDKEKGIRVITIKKDGKEQPIIIKIDKDNQIIEYVNNTMTKIGDSFMEYNSTLRHIEVPNVEEIGNDCLHYNRDLTYFRIPKAKQIGARCLCNNQVLSYLEATNVEKIGFNAFMQNRGLVSLILPNVRDIESGVLSYNSKLAHFEAPMLENLGSACLFRNEALTYLELPNLKQVDFKVLAYNKTLTHFIAPKLEEAGQSFLGSNQDLIYMELSNPPELIQKLQVIIDKNQVKQERESAEAMKPWELTLEERKRIQIQAAQTAQNHSQQQNNQSTQERQEK